MKQLLIIAFFVCGLQSCSHKISASFEKSNNEQTDLPTYYHATLDEAVFVYLTDDTTLEKYLVPKGALFTLAEYDLLSDKPFRVINYNGQPGFIIKRRFVVEQPVKTALFILPPNRSEYLAQKQEAKSRPSVSSSIYSSSQNSTYTGGDVQVKGYYRKNGTYVQPYTRKAPTRKH